MADPLQSILAEMEAERYGWSALDLHRVLDLAGFERMGIEDTQGWPVILRYHPQFKRLNVVLYPTEKTHAAVVEHVIAIIKEAQLRKSQLEA